MGSVKQSDTVLTENQNREDSQRVDSQLSKVRKIRMSIKESVGVDVEIKRHVFDLYT